MGIVKVDKGWAWGVPIAGFIANFIIGGLAKSYGILVIEFQDLFNCSAAALTAAGGLIYTFMYTLSLVTHVLSQKFGYRPVVAFGAIGSTLSMGGAAFAPNVYVFVALIGGGLGISLSMIYSPIFVMTGRCFRRYVGVANGISVAGVSVGQIVFPQLVTILIEKYSARGATFIGSGICLNFLLTAVLMPSKIIEPEIEAKNANNVTNNAVLEGMENLEKSLTSNEFLHKKKSDDKKQQLKIREYPGWLANRLLAVFILSKVFADIGDVGEAIILPPFADDLGYSPFMKSMAISISGCADLVSRLFVGWISDRPGVKRSLILFFTWMIEGINSLVFIYMPNYTGFVISYAVFGVCSGTAMTLMIVVLTDFVGPLRLPKSFGILMLSLGFIIAPGQFFVGHLRDITGSYVWSLRSIFAMMIFSALMLLLEFPVRCYYNKYKPDKAQSPVEVEEEREMKPLATIT